MAKSNDLFDDDDDDTPRRKKPARRNDDDDDDAPRPKSKRPADDDDENEVGAKPKKKGGALKIVLIVGGILGFLGCLGCGGVAYFIYSAASGPKAAHMALVIDMRAGRYADVYDRLDEETKQSYETPANKQRYPGKTGKDLYLAMMNGMEGQLMSGLTLAVIDGEVESVTENGDTADLKIKPRGGFGTGTTTVKMKKEGGKWKVNLTKIK